VGDLGGEGVPLGADVGRGWQRLRLVLRLVIVAIATGVRLVGTKNHVQCVLPTAIGPRDESKSVRELCYLLPLRLNTRISASSGTVCVVYSAVGTCAQTKPNFSACFSTVLF
jgi:hypothetical protein